MIEPLADFAGCFHVQIKFDESLLIHKHGRYFLLSRLLKQLISKDFTCSGMYLGQINGGIFVPSFNLLSIIAKESANKITVDSKTEWLYVCGRDVFKQGIRHVFGSRKRGDYTLVTNERDECLGYGKFTNDLGRIRSGVAVKNLLDIGDFLRREKHVA